MQRWGRKGSALPYMARYSRVNKYEQPAFGLGTSSPHYQFCKMAAGWDTSGIRAAARPQLQPGKHCNGCNKDTQVSETIHSKDTRS